MPKKCESCRYYTTIEPLAGTAERCMSTRVLLGMDRDFVFIDKFIELEPAREICNREGDGIFVYFEPRDPASGAAATLPSDTSPSSPTSAGTQALKAAA